MPNINRFLPIALVFIAACSSTTPPPAAAPATQPAQAEAPAEVRPQRSGIVPIASAGRTCRSAVVLAATTAADGAAREDAWITENYPGATKVSTAATTCNEKPAHQIDIQTANGVKVSLFFDISGWAAPK
ncbi:MAG: hypothetical protein QOC81_2025 [Thermoanaerobaculia bacterium]|jgi:hypothetical protein|nr:hypothetical protein [Thermoanaerobaculia bacterium]